MIIDTESFCRGGRDLVVILHTLGRVRLARHKRTRKLAAVKIVPKIHIGGGRVDPKAERVMQSIRREMVVMKLIHHPHIMDMYDVFEDQDEL